MEIEKQSKETEYAKDNQWIKCAFGLHQVTIIRTENIIDNSNKYDNVKIGENIILQCKHCGKLKIKTIMTRL